MRRIGIILVVMMSLIDVKSFAQNGFSDQSKLIEALLPAMINGDEELNKYISDVCPSTETFETMIALGVSHFGFPEGLETYGYTYESYRSKFSSLLYDLRDRLERDGILEDYEIESIYKEKLVLVNKVGKVYASGAALNLKTQGSEAVISFSEMMKINGVWKVFSSINYL